MKIGQIELKKETREIKDKLSNANELALEAWGQSTENRHWLEAEQAIGSFMQHIPRYLSFAQPAFSHSASWATISCSVPAECSSRRVSSSFSVMGTCVSIPFAPTTAGMLSAIPSMP